MEISALTEISSPWTLNRVTPEYIKSNRAHILQDKHIPDYATVFRIHGPFLFGATDKIADIASQIEALPPVVMLRLRNMTAIDATEVDMSWTAARCTARSATRAERTRTPSGRTHQHGAVSMATGCG